MFKSDDWQVNNTGKFTYDIEDKELKMRQMLLEVAEDLLMPDDVPDQKFAEAVLRMAKLHEWIIEVKADYTIEKMVKDGLLEISSFNENGEPLYGLTEKGEKMKDSIHGQDD